MIKFAVSSPNCLVGHVNEKVSDEEMNVLKVNNFIDQITTKSGRAARIESHGAYYIQATHLQTNSKLFRVYVNDKNKLSVSNKVKRYNYQSTI